MSQFCPNFANPETAKQFKELELHFGTPRAYRLWNLNKGVGFEKLNDDTNNPYFQKLEEEYGRQKAIELYAFSLIHPEYQQHDIETNPTLPTFIKDFDVLQNQLQDIYPDIKVDFTNKPIQREGQSYLGESDIKAKTILIDSIMQNADTLPHEYAHHYIAWFRESAIVQKAIKSFGNEEALVDAIGKQVVQRKGKAYTFWKRFVNWIKSIFNDQKALLDTVTDLFLIRKNLCPLKKLAEIHHQNAKKITYNKEQQAAIDGIGKWLKAPSKDLGDQFCTLSGKAGTGKTTIVKEILSQYLKENRTASILLVAPTHNAKKNLSDAVGNVNGRTLQDFTVASLISTKLVAKENGMIFEKGGDYKDAVKEANVIVIDEASMIENDNMDQIIKIAKTNSTVKIIFLGDPGQINPVGQTSISRAFNVPNNYILLERVRQGEDSPILSYADHYWFDDKNKTTWDHPSDTQTKITDKGSLIFAKNIRDLKTLRTRIVPLFQKAMQDDHFNFARIVVGTNEIRQEYNTDIQRELFGNKIHEKTQLAIGDWVVANVTWGDPNDEGGSFVNSEVGKIIKQEYNPFKTDDKFSCHFCTVEIEKENGYQIQCKSIIPSEREKFKLACKSEHDKITAAYNAKQIDRRAAAKQHQLLTAYENEFADFDLAYAITTHKSQGQTYDIAFIDKSSMWKHGKWEPKERAHLTYTAVTRARKMAIVIEENGENIFNLDLLDIEQKTQSKAVTTHDLKRPVKNGIQGTLNFGQTTIQPDLTLTPEEIKRIHDNFKMSMVGLRNKITMWIKYDGRQQDEDLVRFNELIYDYLINTKTQSTAEYFKQNANIITEFFTYLDEFLTKEGDKLEEKDVQTDLYDRKIIIEQMLSTLPKQPEVEHLSSKKTINIYAGTNENADLSNFATRPLEVREELRNQNSQSTEVKKSEGVLNSTKTILSNEELKLWNEQGVGENPRILVASEHSDPAFNVKLIKDIIKGKKSVRTLLGQTLTGKDFNGLYLITKHDGLPMKELLELPIPKLIHFSITGLGGTNMEPGVMKYNDMLDQIEKYIKMGLDPKCVTMRIDPIVPGITGKETIENIIRRSAEMGITRIKFSIMDLYPDVYTHMQKEFSNYNFDYYYPMDLKKGKRSFNANPNVIKAIVSFMEEMAEKYNVEMHTCAENINSSKVQQDGCLSVSMVNQMLGTYIEDKGKANNKQRKECSCFGGKIDALAYNNKCLSHCWYCYANHQGDKTMEYYNEDGTLKVNRFTDPNWKTNYDPNKKLNGEKPINPLSKITMYSGGAHGADGFWGNIGGNNYGLGDAVHIRSNDQPTVGAHIKFGQVWIASEQDLNTAKEAIKQLTGQTYNNTLLLRNYYQVVNSNSIFAIGEISNGHDVLGGTGIAIQIAQALGKPIYVWDLQTEQWQSYDYDQRKFQKCDTPVLTSKFAGIGTRDIENYMVRQQDGSFSKRDKFVGKVKADKAIQAIHDVYKKTLKEGVNENPIQFTPEQLWQTSLDLKPEEYSAEAVGVNKKKMIDKAFQLKAHTPSNEHTTLNDFLNDTAIPLNIKKELSQNFTNVVLTVIQELINPNNAVYNCETLYPKVFDRIVDFNNKKQTVREHLNDLRKENAYQNLKQMIDVITPNIFLSMCADKFVSDTEMFGDEIYYYAQDVKNNLEYYSVLISPILKSRCGLSFKMLEITSKQKNKTKPTIETEKENNEATNEDLNNSNENENNESESVEDEFIFGDNKNDFLPVDQKTVSIFKNIDNRLKFYLNNIIKLDSQTRLPAYTRFGTPEYYTFRSIILAIMPYMRNVTSESQMLQRLQQSRLPFVNQLIQLCQQDSTLQTLLYTQIKRSYNQYFEIYHQKNKENGSVGKTNIQDADKHVDIFAIRRELMSTATLEQTSLFVSDTILTPDDIYVNENVRLVLVNKIEQIKSNVGKLRTFETYEKFNQECYTSQTEQDIYNICLQMGLNQITKDVIRQFIYTPSGENPNYDNKNLLTLLSQLSLILEKLSQTELNDTIIANQPFVQGKFAQSIYAYVDLLETLYPYRFNDQEAVKWANGKQYPINTPLNYIQKTTQAIRYSTHDELEEFFASRYENDVIKSLLFERDQKNNLKSSKDNPSYIAEILDIVNQEIRELIGFNTFLSHDKTDFPHMSEQQYVSTVLTSFAADGHDTTLSKNHLTRYFLPVLADKTTTGTFTWFKKDSYEALKPYYRTIVKQELLRIRNIYQRAKTNDGSNTLDRYDTILKPDGKLNLKQQNVRFLFLPCFNQFLQGINDAEQCKNNPLIAMMHNEIYQDGLYVDTVKINKAENRSKIDSVIKNYLTESATIWIEKLKEKGIYDIVKEDINLPKLYKSYDFEIFLKSFFFNNFYVNTQFFQLMTGDICFYQHTDDIQKRIAEFVSPGLAHSTTTQNNPFNLDMSTKRAIILQNQKFPSRNYKGITHILDWNYKNKVKMIQQNPTLTEETKIRYQKELQLVYDKYKQGYENIDGTDGQGLISLDYVYKALATLGRQETFEPLYIELKSLLNDLDLKWSKKKKNEWKQKVRDVLNKYPNISIEVMKQFTYSQLQTRDQVTSLNVTRPFQIKNAEYALIDFISMMESEDDTMLQVAKFMNDNQIDALYFKSNCKVGASGIVKTNNMRSTDLIFTLQDIINDPIKSSSYIYDIPMTDVVLQQETPKHYLNNESDLGSQIRKIFLDIVTDQAIIGGKLQDVNINGVSAKQFRDEFEQMLTRKVELNFKNFIENELKLSHALFKKLQSKKQLTKKERLQLNEALSKLCLKTISTQGEITLDDLHAFSLDENGNFNLTTSDPLNFRLIDKVLTTALKHCILDCEVGGGQLVQVTDAFRLNQFNGEKQLDDSLKIWFYDQKGELTDDPKKASRIAYLECEMPVYDKRIIKYYSKKDGSIDMEKIEKECPELLNIIGYRIPTEGLCSMYPIKIKRFCNPIAGGIIKLPQEIVAIGGMDFDIDKLFFCHNSFITNKEKNSLIYPKGSLSHIDKMNDAQINNMLLNHIRTVLTSPLALQYQFMSSSFVRLTHEANLMEAWSLIEKTGDAKKDAELYKDLIQKSDNELETIIRNRNLDKPICSFATQEYLFNRNTESQLMLACFANASTMHSYLKHAQIPIRNVPLPFSLNGHTIMDGHILDDVFSQDGVTTISENLRQMVAGAADGIKCPDLQRMGLNMVNIGYVLPMLRLGFNMHSIALFINQPIVKEFCRLYQTELDKIKASKLNTQPDTQEIIDLLIKKYNGNDVQIDDFPHFDEISLALGIDFKLNSYDPINASVEQKNMHNMQFNLLQIIPFLRSLNNDLVSQSRIIKRDSKTTTRYQDSFEIFHTQLRDDNFLLDMHNGLTIIDSKFAQLFENKNDPTFAHLHKIEEITSLFHDSLIGYLNPHMVYFYDTIRPRICEQFGRILIAKETKTLYYDWLLFLTTNDAHGLLTKEKAMGYYYTYTFPHNFFASLTTLMKDPEISQNTFIQNLQPETFGTNGEHLIISFDSFGLSNETIQQIRQDWLSLLNSKNPEYQNLAKELFIYDLYRNGFQPGNKSYGYLFPVMEKINMENYQNFWERNISSNLTALQENEFIELAARNHPEMLKTVQKGIGKSLYYTRGNIIYRFKQVLPRLGIEHVSKTYSEEHLTDTLEQDINGLNEYIKEVLEKQNQKQNTNSVNQATVTFQPGAVQGISEAGHKKIKDTQDTIC